MLKNNNQAAIKKLSNRTLKTNKARNVFAILAIVLTTFMFTTVFSIGFSMAKSMNTAALRQDGTKASIYLYSPTQEQYEQIKECKYAKAVGLSLGAGEITEDGERIINVNYVDNEEFTKNITPAISDIEGIYPEKENEIMLSKSALNALNIDNPTLNMPVKVTLNGEEKEFKLSGFYKDYQNYEGNAFVSKKYADKMNLTLEKNGMISITPKFASQKKAFDQLLEDVEFKDNQELISSFDTKTNKADGTLFMAGIVIFICLVIVLSGYLLIYNVFYISVSKDIRFYGMLKTIGTSPSQIKKMIKIQSLKLSAIGIPIGIILGYLSSFIAVPMAFKMLNSIYDDSISFNIFIYIGTILFALLTVFLSNRKPAKLASSVSPVEALKYNGVSKQNIKSKKTTNGGKLYKMAYRNVFREKKRAILVFLSLLMGTLAFLSFNAFYSSLKVENFINAYSPNDYDFSFYTDENNINEAKKFTNEIINMKGIKDVSINKTSKVNIDFDRTVYKPFIDRDLQYNDPETVETIIKDYENGTTDFQTRITTMSDEQIKMYNDKADEENKIDIEAFKKGELGIVLDVVEPISKTISMTDAESGKKADIKIIPNTVSIDTPYISFNLGAPSQIIVSEEFMKKLNDDPTISRIIANCDEELEPDVTSKINDLISSDSSIEVYSIKTEEASSFISGMKSTTILTSGISLLLILIGIINFINVILTGIFNRRQELAVMESLGMTKKQIKKMLCLEGFYYAIITIGLIMTIGNAVVLTIGKMSTQIADYAVFEYPLGLMLGIVGVILLIFLTVPALVYKYISKDSVTQRLRAE